MAAERKNIKKEENLIDWYNEIMLRAELVDFSAVKGFAVYRPYGYEMWELTQEFLNRRFKALGVKNTYFPLLIPERILNKEKEHIEGFSVEVAWVTKGGDRDLDEKLAIRPTSETIMYDSYSRWVKSYRDLPLLLNQWNTMVRWETKETRFLLRGRENLWQEGHCVFASKEEAENNVLLTILIYKDMMEELFAIPVLVGRKSEREKFAGAVNTYTVEAVLPNNYVSQAATSHYLGQNFSKPFDIKFLDEKNEWQYGYQTSWGASMRGIGIIALVFGDDKGLVLPPRVAPIQIVVIPILKGEETDSNVIEYSKRIHEKLGKLGIRSVLDDRKTYSAGWKFNEYDLKGVPIKLEIGAREVESESFSIKIRLSGEKATLKLDEVKSMPERLERLHMEMFDKAKKDMDSRISIGKDREGFVSALKNSTAIVKSAWCNRSECEDKIKDQTGATSRLIPLDKEVLLGEKCAFCGEEAKVNAYFAKSY